MSRLDDLKTDLARATLHRNRRVAELRAEIGRINRAYDEVAMRLQREIVKLEPVLETPKPEPAAPKRARTPRKRGDDAEALWAKINAFNEGKV